MVSNIDGFIIHEFNSVPSSVLKLKNSRLGILEIIFFEVVDSGLSNIIYF